MSSLNELKLAKELIRFQSITPRDAGAINFLLKYPIAPASFGVTLGNLISSLANVSSLMLGISLLVNH